MGLAETLGIQYTAGGEPGSRIRKQVSESPGARGGGRCWGELGPESGCPASPGLHLRGRYSGEQVPHLCGWWSHSVALGSCEATAVLFAVSPVVCLANHPLIGMFSCHQHQQFASKSLLASLANFDYFFIPFLFIHLFCFYVPTAVSSPSSPPSPPIHSSSLSL